MNDLAIDPSDIASAVLGMKSKKRNATSERAPQRLGLRGVRAALASFTKRSQGWDIATVSRNDDVELIENVDRHTNPTTPLSNRSHYSNPSITAGESLGLHQTQRHLNASLGRVCDCNRAVDDQRIDNTTMRLLVADLPKIVDVLVVDGMPKFTVLHYCDFIWLNTILRELDVPDAVSVLDFADEHAFVVVGYTDLALSLLNLEITGEINEEAYLKQHVDVAAAVAQGALRSAREHYVIQGYLERRIVRFPDASLANPDMLKCVAKSLGRSNCEEKR